MAKDNNIKEQPPKTISCVYLSFTPCHFNIDGKDFSLHNNETYELPDSVFVQSLIAQGKLVVKNK